MAAQCRCCRPLQLVLPVIILSPLAGWLLAPERPGAARACVLCAGRHAASPPEPVLRIRKGQAALRAREVDVEGPLGTGQRGGRCRASPGSEEASLPASVFTGGTDGALGTDLSLLTCRDRLSGSLPVRALRIGPEEVTGRGLFGDSAHTLISKGVDSQVQAPWAVW